MSLNANSLFATNPNANIHRSRFDMSQRHTTTFNSFELVPIFWTEVLPADTFTVDTAVAARLQTLLYPIFDDIYLDVYWFYSPTRLLWKNWTRFLGESPTPWFEDYQVDTPQISINVKSREGTACVGEKTVADYLGCPLAPSTGTGTGMLSVTHMPFRMYSRVYNEWFRSEVVDNMTAFNDEDNSVTMNNAGAPFYGGPCLVANKFADLWTRGLPEPQIGEPVTLGIEQLAPVFAVTADNDFSKFKGTTDNLRFNIKGNNVVTAGSLHNLYGYGIHHTTTGVPDQFEVQMNDAALTSSPTMRNATPSNLVADLAQASGISINNLRQAFATQRYLETLARSGNRYIEYLQSIWGVTAPDQRLQRTEFLGGNRVALNINQTVSSAHTSDADLGDVGAYSLTTDVQNSFTKSFVEHGYLMAIACVRWKPTYQNGFDPKWFRTDVYSYYNPIFARLGEQPVLNKTIFATGNSATDNEVFAYNEAWAEYRYSQNRVSAEMRSDITNTLDSWHLADDYDSLPTLSAAWLKGNKNVLDRVLAVKSDTASQILADFYFKIDATRAMPIRSIPGLSVL